MDTDSRIRALETERDNLKASMQLICVRAYAATNPANWQKNDTPEERIKHYEKTLDEIADCHIDINILEETFSLGVETGRAEIPNRGPDVDTFVRFAELMGYPIICHAYDGLTYVKYDDTESKDIVNTHGYEQIDFLGVFDSASGRMIRAYNVSHVALPRAEWATMLLEDERAVPRLTSATS